MRAYVRKHDMLLGKESVLIAVSGGADSMALLEMVTRLAPLMKLQVGIAHFDHELRGEESRKDAAFVNEQARERGLKIFIGRAEVQRLAAEQKLSLEDAARKARYQFLERVARRHGYSVVLAGHTADDNAETLLMNLLRGSGVTGLAGIPPVRSLGRGLILARPLLWAGRSEIREFVQQTGIQWREDESNQNMRFLRNRVRQELLPALQQFNPSIVNTLNSTADIMRGVEQHLGHSVRTAIEQVTAPRNNEQRSNDVVELNLNQLKHLLPAIQSELIQRIVCQRFDLSPIPHSAVERTLGLVWKETGSKAEIIDGISALRDRETLILRRDPPPFIPFERSFELGATIETGKARLVTRRMKNSNIQFNNNRSIEFIDADRLPKRLILRSWREGDRFQPLGMNGEKKVSDFLIDEKVALDAKRDVLVLANDQHIIWICGMRLDERYRVTSETQNVLRLEFVLLRRQQEQTKQTTAQPQTSGQQPANAQKPQALQPAKLSPASVQSQPRGQQAGEAGAQSQQQRGQQPKQQSQGGTGQQQQTSGQRQPKQQSVPNSQQQTRPQPNTQQPLKQQAASQQPKQQGRATTQPPLQRQQPQEVVTQATPKTNQQQAQQSHSRQQKNQQQGNRLQQGALPQQQRQQPERQQQSRRQGNPVQGQEPHQQQPMQGQVRPQHAGQQAQQLRPSQPQQSRTQQQHQQQDGQGKQQPPLQQSENRQQRTTEQRTTQQPTRQQPNPQRPVQPQQQPKPQTSARPQQPVPAMQTIATEPPAAAEKSAKPARAVGRKGASPVIDRPANEASSTQRTSLPTPTVAVATPTVELSVTTQQKKKASTTKNSAPSPTTEVAERTQPKAEPATKRPTKKAASTTDKASKLPTDAATTAKPKRAATRKQKLSTTGSSKGEREENA